MKVLCHSIRVVFAGLIAIIILSLMMCFYSLLPVHVENVQENTDYVWPANSIWVTLTEGIAWGRFDENGYNNLSVVDNPDIIVLGSSHMEAINVFQTSTAAYKLNEKLDGHMSVYNMGISGHDFFKVCQYIPKNIELYDTVPKVIIVETSTVDVTKENVEQVINGTMAKTSSHNNGIVGVMQRVPFFRRVYRQLVDVVDQKNILSIDDEEMFVAIPDVYSELFEYLSEIEKKYDTQIIIFYHPTGKFASDGSVVYEHSESLSLFKETAIKKGINFIDMTDSFETMYDEEHKVPHGFVTGRLEEGHLNATGHMAIANELYKEIEKMKENGDLCN